MIFFYALLNGGTNQLKNPSKNDNFLFILSFYGHFLCIGYKTDVAFSTKIVCQKLYKKSNPRLHQKVGDLIYIGGRSVIVLFTPRCMCFQSQP